MLTKILARRPSLDKLGMSLSFLCALHCVLTPFVLMSLPILDTYVRSEPWFHLGLALFIIPIGAGAFISGYRHHQRPIVLFLGFTGLAIVGAIPVFFNNQLNLAGPYAEAVVMITGSTLLITAHWINRRSCACDLHGHRESV